MFIIMLKSKMGGMFDQEGGWGFVGLIWISLAMVFPTNTTALLLQLAVAVAAVLLQLAVAVAAKLERH